MKGYLGEFPVDVTKHKEYSKYTPKDWALKWMSMYGQIDGAHHKQWCLDQVARLLHGGEVTVTEARWENGHTEYRFHMKSNKAYDKWVEDYEERDENGEVQYFYDTGFAP